jgi:PAS domain S-box-containing protein
MQVGNLNDRWRRAGLTITLALLLGLGALAMGTARELRETSRDIHHRYATVEAAASTLSHFRNSQSIHLRGLLTGSAASLDQGARRETEAAGRDLERLTHLVEGRPLEMTRVQALRELVVQHEAMIRELMTQVPDGRAVGLAYVRSGRSAEFEDELSNQVAGLIDQERQGLAALEADEAAIAGGLRWQVGGGSALALLLGTASMLSLGGEIRRRRLLEAQLRQTVADATDLYEHAPCGYHSLDREGRFVRVNLAEAKWLGASPHDLHGRPYREFLDPESRERFDAVFSQSVQGQDDDHVELELRLALGGRAVAVTANALRDSDGSFVRSRATSVDVTFAKEAEAEREQLIAELRHALANVRTLSGLLPMCAWCKKIRNDKGYYEQIEAFLLAHADVQFSHGICPECNARLVAEDSEV